VGHSYTLPTIKLLFATARTCAYPGCATPLVHIDEGRGVREIAVQIAHIRSAKPDGPRYDPAFPADRLNREENLLLLCTLCRRRHKVHYADLRIMPIWWREPLVVALRVAERSA
jgi:hypothetical protein